MSSLSCKSIFIGTLASIALLAASAHAQTTLNLVSNSTTTRLSTVVETDNSNDVPWSGVNLSALPGGTLPSSSTYTIVPTGGGGVAIQPGTGNDALICGSDVQFFRTNFTLPNFTNLSFSFQGTVDNDLDIFINGHELAEEGDLNASSFSTPYGVSVAANGTVTNAGPSSSAPFDRVAGTFPQSFFTVGTNNLVVAVRNESASTGDTGSYSMLSVVKYTAVSGAAPEPGSVALLGTCLLPMAVRAARRRRTAERVPSAA